MKHIDDLTPSDKEDIINPNDSEQKPRNNGGCCGGGKS